MNTCTRCRSALEADDLRCPVCAAATPPRLDAVERKPVTVLRCDGCGASLGYDAERKAPHCAFCGETTRLEQTQDPLEQAEHALPFQVDEHAAGEALTTFLAQGGFFRPPDLATAAGLDQIRPLFWAAWVFDAEADVAFATDSNVGHGQSQWAPHAGVTRMRFESIALSASKGLTAAETRSLTSHYDLNTARSIRDESSASLAPLGPTTSVAERFELQRSAARKGVTDAITKLAVVNVRSGVAPGTAFRNTHVSLVLRGLFTRRVLFPVWILSYRYDGKPYRVVVHGQRPQVVLGERPLSKARILMVVLLVLAVLAAIAAALSLTAGAS